MYYTYKNADGEQASTRVEATPSEGQSVVKKPRLCYWGRLGADAYSSTDEMILSYVKYGRRWEWVDLEPGDPERQRIEQEILGG